MIEHYSSRIQNIIQKEIFDAKDSIKIAVAWFTNNLLFQPLIMKLMQGVTVELILNDDDINRGDSNNIDFNQFIEHGGVLYWNNSKRLLHEKFCIIDSSIVIFGSYNWTNKAEFNEESISLARNDNETNNFYNKRFENLSKKYTPIYKNISHVETTEHLVIPDNNSKLSNLESIKCNRPELKRDDTNGLSLFPGFSFYDEITLPNRADYFLCRSGEKYFLRKSEDCSLISSSAFDIVRSINIYCRLDFIPDFVAVCVNHRWGILNTKTGDYIINPIYKSLDSYDSIPFKFIYSNAMVFCLMQDDMTDWIYNITTQNFYKVRATSFRLIAAPKISIYKDESNIENQKIWILKNKEGKYAIFDDGQMVSDFEFDEFEVVEKFFNVVVLRKGKYWGYYGSNFFQGKNYKRIYYIERKTYISKKYIEISLNYLNDKFKPKQLDSLSLERLISSLNTTLKNS